MIDQLAWQTAVHFKGKQSYPPKAGDLCLLQSLPKPLQAHVTFTQRSSADLELTQGLAQKLKR